MPSSLSPLVFPPLDGSLSIPDMVDFNIKHNPSEPAFVFSFDDQPDTITRITHLEFGRAIHRAAHIVRPNDDGQSGSVVAIIANLDPIVYQALVLGLMRAGLVPFPISPRNPTAAVVSLLLVTSCHRILATPLTLGSLLDDVQSQISEGHPDFGLQVEVAPPIRKLYPHLGKESEEDAFSAYPPLHKCFQPTDVCMYQHSSGSTGFPKAIPHSVRSVVEWPANHFYSTRARTPRLRMGAMALPPFHSTGFIMHILYPVCGLISLTIFPPSVWEPTDLAPPPTPDSIFNQLKRTHANGVLMIPMILEGMAKSMDMIDYLRNFEYVGYGGGPMPKSLGNSLVASGINLQAGYGSTEAGPLTVVQLNRDPNLHWDWLEFNEKVNIRWVPQGDGTFEAQLLTSDTYHPSVENLDDTKGYATSDLFVPHPTLERFWKIVGRVDDVIAHSSGEKTIPVPMERIMTATSIIQGAVMFGRGHNQTGVLLEPIEELSIDLQDQKQVADFRNRAWPIIEEANLEAPAFSRIYKEMILIVSPDKPLPRSTKGTIMRKVALALYEQEIESLYKTIETNTAGDHVSLPDVWDTNALGAWLLRQATDIQSGRRLDSSRDLFEQGFDSLSTAFLRLRIAGALGQMRKKPNPTQLQNIVYKYPVIDNLAGYLTDLISDSEHAGASQSAAEAIENMIAKYSVGSDEPLGHRLPAGHVLLVTGTTGNLGSQILEQLLRRNDVARVYALNRHSDSSSVVARLESRFKDKELNAELLRLPKLVLLEGDLTQDGFGLPMELYTQVQNLVTIIIHVAWRLDFNLTLSSFEPSIRGTRRLIDFAKAGPHASRLRFLYTSSVGSAQGWSRDRGPYPEEVLYDASTAVGTGYGESKYVAERILTNSGLNATSIRIGQISGGHPNGAWAILDWVPILIKSSLAIGSLPDAPGTISWLPMNIVAQSILDMAFYSGSLPMAVNLSHPKPIPWTAMFTQIRKTLLERLSISEDSVPMVSFNDWIHFLEAKARNADQDVLRKVPAIKLLDFFRKMRDRNKELSASERGSLESGGFPIFAIDKAQSLSPTLRELDQLNTGDAERWIKYWVDVGFLQG